MARTMDIEANADNDALEEWEYLLLGLRGPNTQPSWLNVEPIKVLRRHSGTRRYGVTDKQSRRDNARHAGTREDRSGKRAWDFDGKQRLRSRTQPLTDVDHEQELDGQHREAVDKSHLGIKRCWREKFLATIKERIRMNRGLSWWDTFTLERLGITVEQLEVEVAAEGLEPLADWERELLEAGSDADAKTVAMPERNPFRTDRRRYVSIPTAPPVPAGFAPHRMDRDDYRELARSRGYRSGGRVRLFG